MTCTPTHSRAAAAMILAFVASAAVAQNPTGALAGREIVVSPGHGYYWHSTLGWTTQRPLIDGLIEDIHNHEIVFDHLLPYLEDTGAGVILCRARSRTSEEHVIQNDLGAPAYTETGFWTTGGTTGWAGSLYRYATTNPAGGSTASFRTTITTAGYYPVYLAWRAGTNRTTQARIEVTHAAGTSWRTVDQTRYDLRWVYVGTFPFAAMQVAVVTISNQSPAAGAVIADAVKIGDGFGTIVRGGTTSGQPRWKECSRYHAQDFGAPATVYDSISGGQDNDDDVTCRPRFGEWYAGGQADLFLSLHTNAGGGTGTSTYIHDTAPTPGSAQWQQVLHARLITDLQASWSPTWVDRGMLSANFGEVRLLSTMPGCLVELAFHDDLGGDVEALHHPRFRRIAGRAMGRAILEYLAPGSPFLLDPPASLAMRNDGQGGLVLSWAAVPGAAGYRVRLSTDGFAFTDGQPVASTSIVLPALPPGALRFARVAAVNPSGTGPDSEPVGARAAPGGLSPLLLVNGFDRNDRYVKEAENPHHWLTVDGAAVQAVVSAGYPFDGCTNEAVASGAVPLIPYRCVGWILGEESTVDETFSTAEQVKVGLYVAGGGRFFFSGAEVGWDLDQNGSTADRAFYEQTLGQDYVADDAGTYYTQAQASGPLGPLPAMQFDDGSHGAYNVDYPDVIQPKAGTGGQTVLRYAPGTGAGVLHGNGRVLGLGFPIEALVNAADRTLLLERILALLCPLPVHWAGAPAAGQALAVDLDFPSVPGQGWIAGAALGVAPGLPLGDGRTVPLNPDFLLFFSLDPGQVIFSGMTGTLDPLGHGSLQVHVPADPSVHGVAFYLSAVTVNAQALITQIAPWVRVTIP